MNATVKFKLMSKQSVAKDGILYRIEKGKSFARMAKIANPCSPWKKGKLYVQPKTT